MSMFFLVRFSLRIRSFARFSESKQGLSSEMLAAVGNNLSTQVLVGGGVKYFFARLIKQMLNLPSLT